MAEFSLILYGQASELDRLLARWAPPLKLEREDIDRPPDHSFVWCYPDLDASDDAQLRILLEAIEDPMFELFRTYAMCFTVNIYVGPDDAISIGRDLLLRLGALRVGLTINGLPTEEDE